MLILQLFTILKNNGGKSAKRKTIQIVIKKRDTMEKSKTTELTSEPTMEEMFNHFMENSPMYVFFKDDKIRAIHLSRNYEKMLGKPLQELLGKTMDELFSSELARNMVADDLRVLKKGKPITVEEELNGRFYTTTKFPIIDKGKSSYLAGYTMDITERKLAEEALRKAEEKLRSIIINSLDGIVVADENCVIIEWNSAQETITGLKRADVIGRPLWEIQFQLAPEDVKTDTLFEQLKTGLSEVVSGKTDWPGEITEQRIRCHDGTLKTVQTSSFVIGNKSCKNIVTFLHDITDHKRAEKALRESEKRFKMLVENAFEGITIIGLDGNVTYESPALSKLLGYTLGEKIGTGAFKSVHPDDLERTQEFFIRAAAHPEETLKMDLRIQHKDGTWRWIECAGRNLLKDPGINGIVVNYRDFTERKRMEEVLRESEERFRSIIETSQEWMWAIDTSGRHTYCNPAVGKILGYSPAEIVGQDAFQYLHEEDAVKIKDMFPDFVAQKKGWTGIVLRWRHKDGSYRYLESNSTAIFSEDGELAGFWGADRDITERKKAEEKLKRSETLFSTAFLLSPAATILSRAEDGMCIDANEAYAELVGFPRAEIVGHTTTELNIWMSTEERNKVISELARSGRLRNVPLTLRKKDGSLISTVASGEMVIIEGQRRILSFFYDITDRIRAEEEHLKYEQQLQQNQKLESLGVLAGGIAHDFNNLMSGIFGYIDLARSSSKDKNVTGYLSTAMGIIDRARNLTQQLLTFAKGGAPVREIGSLVPVIREGSQFALSGSNVSCVLDIDERLWFCNFDKNQIGQVLDNILINAQQAMPMGGTISIAAKNISLRAEEKGNLQAGKYVKISVHDTGIGIPKEILPHIFDPFFTTKQKGSGVGLAISHSIVKRHGGSIEVESEPGNGTTFHIYLPASGETPATSFSSKPASIHRGIGRILIMDDEEIIRNSLEKILSSMGYSVVCRKDGAETLSFFVEETNAGRSFAAILLDLTVPGGMGGKETAVEIRKLNTDIPLFVTSGYSEDPVIADPENYGFTDSIRKPFTIEELTLMLGRYLKNGQ
jgi:two-component system, cell cycle sensor histidine kinase and response regulator CckA